MTKNTKEYLGLAALLSVGLGLFIIFGYDRKIQIAVTILMGAAYIIWGVSYHLPKKELYWQVIAEYFFISLLVTSVVIFLLLRA